MPKFFVNPDQVKGDEIEIIGDNLNHIKNVLRLAVDDEIAINDRQGNDYKCIIKSINSECLTVAIKEKLVMENEPNTEVTLFQPLIKGEKMEWVIQKTIELGVYEIILITPERCVVKIESDKKLKAKMDRWNKIAEAAAKQSGRSIIPLIKEPVSLGEAIAYAKAKGIKAIIPYEKEREVGLAQVLKQAKSESYGIFIGPEGGFTEEEVQRAIAGGVHSVTLGKRILRSETASIAALTTIMYEMGEMI